MKLYHFPISPNSRRVWAVINHLDLECELIPLDLAKGEQMSPEFIAINPNHQIPTLVDGDFILWESNAIMTYLCDKTPWQDLLPTETQARADVLRWLFWNASNWNSACGAFVFERLVKPLLKLGDADPAKLADGEARFHRFAAVLNDHLAEREWLSGGKLTLADYSVGAMLSLAEPAGMPWGEYANIKRWWASVEALEAWKRTAA